MTVESREGGGPESSTREFHVLLVLAAAKVSEPRIACYQQMPNTVLSLIGHESRPPAKNLIRLPATRIPYLGAPERWTAALSWFRGIDDVDPGPVDCVMSMELYNPTSVQAQRLAHRLGVPHVVTIAELLQPCPRYAIPPWRQISRTVSRSADAFACNVELARTSAVARGCPPERSVVISPGIDVTQFTPQPGGLTEDPVVVYVGELRADKGIREVVAAIAQAQSRIPDVRLVIAGDGPLREEVVTRAQQNSAIQYVGKVARDALPDLYRSARVFVLAPHTRRFWAEQFGFASVEAMASGLPVVITDSGAVPDVIPSWNPICRQGDVTALAEGLVAALGDCGEQWGAKNRAYAENSYDGLKQAVKLRDWLQTLKPGVP